MVAISVLQLFLLCWLDNYSTKHMHESCGVYVRSFVLGCFLYKDLQTNPLHAMHLLMQITDGWHQNQVGPTLQYLIVERCEYGGTACTSTTSVVLDMLPCWFYSSH